MSMQDLFAEAVERLVAGEPATSIVQSYPTNVQEELTKLLAVVELADHMAVQPMPSRSPMQRQRARSAFLQQAHSLRSEAEQGLGTAGLAGAAAPILRPAPPRPSWSERLRNFFDAPLLRLSPVAPLVPLVAVVVAVTLATFWTVQGVKAALPGQPAYPLKQWMRQQSITLASPELRPEAEKAAEEEIAGESITISTQPSSRNYLDAEYSEAMIFYGRQGNRLLIGPFQVAPNFQPDPNEEVFVPMLLDGDLEPGARVQLVYRLLPGGTKVVQGVSAAVIEGPQPTPPPTPAPTPPNDCQLQLPSDWIPYAVRAGDSLQSLAQRSGTSVAAIQRVNCIDSLGGVGTIYLPERIVVRVTPPAMPSPLPTYTPWPTPTAEPTLEPTLAPTLAPTLEPTTTEPQLTATPEPPTTQPTGAETPVTTEPGATATPVNGTPAGTATPWETPAPGETATPGATAPAGTPTPLGTPAATTTPATPAPGETPTGELTAQPTVETTEPASTPTALATAMPTVAPLTATPDATTQPDEPAATVATTATQAREPAATPAPTEAPTGASEPTREPPTPEPPTREPPTREPPTREPPTREPPTPEPPPTRAPEPTPVPAQVDPPTPIPPADTSSDGDESAP